MKRIAVFYASEGTGHRAAAEALRDCFLLDNPQGEVFCVDILDYIPAFLRRLVSGGYLFMARYAPWAWGCFYKKSDGATLTSRLFAYVHDRLCGSYLPRAEEDIRGFAPEAVFFTHYFGAAPFAGRNSGIFPIFCVDTDFLTHYFQRSGSFTASFAASGEAVLQRQREGIENTFCTGVPIAPKFMDAQGKDAARERLGLEREKVTVLLSGGGIGAGSVEEALASLAVKSEWQTVVICGSNRRLYSRLSRKYASSHNIRIEAFVTNMNDYYDAADIAVMKPGGLSSSEALTFGLPLLLMDPIPGQEELNLCFLERQGAAVELKAVGRAASVVKNILGDAPRLAEMKLAASELARPLAAREILTIAERVYAREAELL